MTRCETMSPRPVRRAARHRGTLAVALLLMLAGSAPAFAETGEDEAAVETVVFVGELVSIEPLPNPCTEEAKRTGELTCIIMDDLYRATYRVRQPVIGQPAAQMTFDIADHYGFPLFAHFPHALVFVGLYNDGPWLHKYQGIPMHLTADGQWAACGEVDYRGVDGELSHRAKPLTFTQPIASKSTFDKQGWQRLLPVWKEQRDTYQITRGQVHCLKGIPLQETYEIVRQGVMSAREVPLPPWPANP